MRLVARLAALLLAVLLVTGCAVAGGQNPVPEPRQVSIKLAGGKAEPSGERLELSRGQTLVLTITSDHADAIHVHGYDLEIPVAAGATVTKEVVLDKVGRFEVESHDPVFTILQLTVR